MLISGRTLLLVMSVIVVAVAVVIFVDPSARWLAIVVAVCGVVSILVLNIFHPTEHSIGPAEPDDMSHVSEDRRNELIRGTSKYLREMKYRYSIRSMTADSSDRRCFSAEVNTVQLGFIPAIIIDNTTDRQGYGYVAFVYDGKRWRGPGLPCPDGQSEAVRHAARCVSPLATEEETSISQF